MSKEVAAGEAANATNPVNSKMYNCPAPWVTTPCIKSSWAGWKDDRAAFQRVCNDGKGRLVDFPDDSKAIDCGKPCFACSFIAVCCDPKGPPNLASGIVPMQAAIANVPVPSADPAIANVP